MTTIVERWLIWSAPDSGCDCSPASPQAQPLVRAGGRNSQAVARCSACTRMITLAVVNKPAGLSVQGEVRTRLALGLTPTSIRGDVGDDQPLWRPQHVHRLDTPTSGLLVCAKTGQALRELSASFAARRVHKRYRALLYGRLVEPDGTTTTPLSGQAARTECASSAVSRRSRRRLRLPADRAALK